MTALFDIVKLIPRALYEVLKLKYRNYLIQNHYIRIPGRLAVEPLNLKPKQKSKSKSTVSPIVEKTNDFIAGKPAETKIIEKDGSYSLESTILSYQKGVSFKGIIPNKLTEREREVLNAHKPTLNLEKALIIKGKLLMNWNYRIAEISRMEDVKYSTTMIRHCKNCFKKAWGLDNEEGRG